MDRSGRNVSVEELSRFASWPVRVKDVRVDSDVERRTAEVTERDGFPVPGQQPIPKWRSLSLAIAIALCVVLVGARIVFSPPTADEALVAVPAWNLAHHGSTGTTVLVAANSPWKGINQRTYNTLPGGILYLAAWFKVFPTSIVASRLAFVLWGAVLLAASFVFLRKLTGSVDSAILATALLALNYNFILGAAVARVDVMTAAVGVAALASYCEIRVHSLKAAVLVSATLAVFACLTHPEGLLYVSGLVILALYLDRRSLSVVHFTLAAMPFAICGALWLWYVAQDPGAALSQLAVNAKGQGRFPTSMNPMHAVTREFRQRYLRREGASASASIWKLVLLVIPFASAAGLLLTRSLRKQQGLRLILLLTAGVLIIQTFFENSKFHFYLIHIEMFYCALTAVFALHAWRAGRWQRVVATGAVAAYILINIGAIASRLRADLSEGGFRPALAFLQSRVTSRELVIGPSTFWFDCCGPNHNLIDDPDFGVTSGLLPDYFIDEAEEASWNRNKKGDPALLNAIQARRAQFDLVYDRLGYRIYRRR
jgi:hypothetical protein